MSKTGKQTQVDIRELWPTEFEHFNPWVASPEGLQMLGDAIGLKLERGEHEVEIGSFRADVVCVDTSDGESPETVVIENQLTKSDHKHLGQLVTYAGILPATTCVWVAPSFHEDHLASVNWLNNQGNGLVRYFCVEVSVRQPGESGYEPSFSPVLVHTDTSSVPISDLIDARAKFWHALNGELKRRLLPVSVTLDRLDYQRFTLGHKFVCLSVVREAYLVRARLYTRGGWHRDMYDELKEQQVDINRELRITPDDWFESETYCTVGYVRESHLFNRSNWADDIDWIDARLDDLRRVFGPRLAKLHRG